MAEISEADLREIEELFVQTAGAFESDWGRITLQGLSPLPDGTMGRPLSPISVAGVRRRERRRL